MSTVAAQPFSGIYRSEPVHSSFAFAVCHSGLNRYRGSLSDATAALRADGEDLLLEGSASVYSISIVELPQFRAHVLGPDFFDAARHPEVIFCSTEVRLDDDGRAEVDGELTIRRITHPVIATGRYAAPRPGAFGGEVAGLELQTSFDRRDFGMDWQMEMPGGGDMLAWDVELTIELRLERDDGGAE
jgi:polyisoprenoid-binding protein YceI